MHDDVFGHHRVAARWLDLAERRLRQFRMMDKGLDPGRAAEHRLQIRQFGKRIEIGPDEGEVFDILNLAGLRPDADVELGKLRREIVAPSLRITDLSVEIDDQQRHLPSGSTCGRTIASLARKSAAYS